MTAPSQYPLVTDIRRHRFEDGPGIRTVVFFKGCPLRCEFCQNPETIDFRTEVVFSPGKCIACYECRSACENGAISIENPTRVDRELCLRCGACAEACPGGGMRLIGRHHAVQDLFDILMRDIEFYRHSGGGVTLSGGECTSFPAYLESLLKRLKNENIHVLLETAGFFDFGVFSRRILPWVDTVYFDIKLADPEQHLKYTGRNNRRILDNLRRLVRTGVDIQVRMPLIPAVTDTPQNLSGVIDILIDCGISDFTVLAYNPLGNEMAALLGHPPRTLPQTFPKREEEERIHLIIENMIREKTQSIFSSGTEGNQKRCQTEGHN